MDVVTCENWKGELHVLAVVIGEAAATWTLARIAQRLELDAEYFAIDTIAIQGVPVIEE